MLCYGAFESFGGAEGVPSLGLAIFGGSWNLVLLKLKVHITPIRTTLFTRILQVGRKPRP